MKLTMLYDFLLVLLSKRKKPTKNDYFTKHIIFTIIYLLQEQELNPNKYSEQEINMNIFSQPTEHEVYMYAKTQCINMDRYL
jgi:hypothetical protein